MKRLTKSSNNKIIFGVCGGLAEYFGIDATIIRILWFILAIPSFGTLAIAYLISSFIIPEDDGYIYQDGEQPKGNNNGALYVGLGLILVGGYLLLRMIYPEIFRLVRYWPVLLIFLGLFIIFGNKKSN